MKDESVAHGRWLVLYGLPMVMLVFFVTASREFSYSPEETFNYLGHAEHLFEDWVMPAETGRTREIPAPLWLLILNASRIVQVESLLWAKLTSLLCAALSVVLTFLITFEISRERTVAFCAALAMSMQSWLLLLAPSGSPDTVMLMFVLAALFMVLRNAYVGATILVTFAALISWVLGLFFVLIVADVLLNSVSRKRAAEQAVYIVLLFLTIVASWVMVAYLMDFSHVPRLAEVDRFRMFTAAGLVVAGLLGVIVVGAIVLALNESLGKLEFMRKEWTPFSWLVVLLLVSLFIGERYYLLMISVLVVYACAHVGRIVVRMTSRDFYALPAFLLAGILLAQSQVDFNTIGKAHVSQITEENEQMIQIAGWIQENVPADASISAERRATVEYLTGRRTEQSSSTCSGETEFVVTRQRMEGYKLLYRPADTAHPPFAGSPYGVWKKQL